MPENLYPQLPTAPSMNQESFNIEMVRKYYQDIVNLKEKYTEKQQKYKNAYNRLLHASTGASSVALASGVSTIGTSVTVVGLNISASLAIVNTVSTCVGACLLLTSKKYKKKLLTLRAPRVLVPTPSTKGGVEKDPPQYLKNEKRYKPETFGGVMIIL